MNRFLQIQPVSLVTFFYTFSKRTKLPEALKFQHSPSFHLSQVIG
jgi:hypothetical protein